MAAQKHSMPDGTLAPPARPHFRRLSSKTAERADLFAGPATIVPDDEMNQPGEAHETAMAMAMAKQHLAEGSSRSPSPPALEETSSTAPTTPDEEITDGVLRTTGKYAYAFDIDGVLIRGGNVIPEAIDAMKALNGQNEYNVKV